MAGSEPPSRIPPRGINHDSKAARDELSSKGKVEKVREVDADETRKRNFMKFYNDQNEDEGKIDPRPSPFDLASGKLKFQKEEDAAIPSPNNAPPPDVSRQNIKVDSDEVTEDSLPQSENFWEEVDFPPDRPLPPKSFKETKLSPEPNDSKKKPGDNNEKPVVKGSLSESKKREPSHFGPPGKPQKESFSDEKQARLKMEEAKDAKRKIDHIEESASVSRALEKEEERYLTRSKKSNFEKEKKHEENYVFQDPKLMPLHSQARDESREGKKERDRKVVEIVEPSLPTLPADIQPIAMVAANQASPYLHPSTISLFYQMVGTMYVMAGPRGISRTEIVLNNPSYADSKFFGATIRIEKYATAPDSFNITLKGSNQAIVTFKENIPSLMNAFQNGNFNFKVNRIDVEYTTERPVFRRKEKGDDKGESDSDDLGEGRK